MKKSFLKEPFSLLRSNAVKGAFVLAFFGFFIVAYAVTFPPDPQSPRSTVLNVIGFGSSGDGSTPGDYAGADAICEAVETGASLCDQKDILHTINNVSPNPFDATSGSFWINGGLSSGPNVIANDCQGWQASGSGDVFGVVYNSIDDQFQMQDCRSSLEFACCR